MELCFAAQVGSQPLRGRSTYRGGSARRPLGRLEASALLASFGATGHAAAVASVAGLFAAARVATGASWLGGLPRACPSLPVEPLVALVRRFSRVARLVVRSLVASGAGLVPGTPFTFIGSARVLAR